MHYANTQGYPTSQEISGDIVRDAFCGCAKRVSWANSCLPGDVAVEFCIWGVLCHQCVSGMGIERACRHLVRAEKHWKIRISKGCETF